MSIYSRQILLTNPITLILLSLSVFKFFEDRRERERETHTQRVSRIFQSVGFFKLTSLLSLKYIFFFLIEVKFVLVLCVNEVDGEDGKSTML